MYARHTILLALVFLLFGDRAYGQSWPPLPLGEPSSAGFSAERLKDLDVALQQTVDRQQLAGAVIMMARHGKLVAQKAYGLQSIERKKEMQPDTIFKISSMAKPITGTAMMILYEEGKWKASDPIAKHIPQLANPKVYVGAGKRKKPKLEPAVHAPTVGELMSDTAGFASGTAGDAVDSLYKKSGILQARSLDDFVAKLARLPLAYQPGEAWRSSIAADVQAYLVEKLSGKPFSVFVRDRILVPLGMNDTDFFVPTAKTSRLATVYRPSATQPGLMAVPHEPSVHEPPRMASGVAGLYATAGDYLRFAQMLLNGGSLNGERILSPSTVALLRSNHLPERLLTGTYGVGPYLLQPGLGFGYDVVVMNDPIRIGSTAGKGSYLWNGASGTWFWIDPTNDLVFVGMAQRMASESAMHDLENLSRTLVYQALTEPAK